jgi:hypothetical protein
MNNATYVIVDASSLADLDFSKLLNNGPQTNRYSVDGSKSVVKFEGDTPSFLIGEPQYDHAEILNILRGPEWSDPDAIP